MAESIGLASGLLALTTFAFQASITLFNTLRSFQSHPKRVRDLIEELEALSGVLGPLAETVSATTASPLSALDLPLLRCGKSCKEFEQELIKCSSQSGSSRTSFRGWARLKYMGEDVDGFRRLLAGYKLTISIALTDASLRKSSATAEALESYNDLIKTTTADLEARLESIDEKLENIVDQSGAESDSSAAERQLIKEERTSTRRCLEICTHLSEHISQIQLAAKSRGSSVSGIDEDTFPERVVNIGLEECKNSLMHTAAKLDRHLQDLMDRLVHKSKGVMTSHEDVNDLARLQDEWKTTRQCMEICSRADHHLKENISTIDNYATGDAVQFMVSTNNKIIHGRNRGLGWRTRQVGGHLDNVSLQQLSRDIMTINIQNTRTAASTSPGGSSSVPADGLESGLHSSFRERYGQGFKLTSDSVPDVAAPPTRLAGSSNHTEPKT